MNYLIIGNGESRKNIDLSVLYKSLITPNDHCFSIGCNSIYKEFSPDRLVVSDQDALEDVMSNWVPKFNRKESSFPEEFRKLILVRAEEKLHYNNSGIFAIEYALKKMKSYDSIYCVGFDNLIDANDVELTGGNMYDNGFKCTSVSQTSYFRHVLKNSLDMFNSTYFRKINFIFPKYYIELYKFIDRKNVKVISYESVITY